MEHIVLLLIVGGFALLAGLAWRRQMQLRPRVLLDELPGVLRADPDEWPGTPGIAEFRAQFTAFADDFERTGHHYPYRQLIDLLACGPLLAAVEAAGALSRSTHLRRFAGDLELRNELGEIVAFTLPLSTDREQRATFVRLLEQLATLAGRHPDALGIWLAPLVVDLTGADERRRAHAVFALARVGTDEQIAAARAAAGDDALLAAEFRAGREPDAPVQLPPLPPSPGGPRAYYVTHYDAQFAAARPAPDAVG